MADNNRSGFLIDGVDVGSSTAPSDDKISVRVPTRIRVRTRHNVSYSEDNAQITGFGLSTSISVVKLIAIVLIVVNFFRALRGDIEYFSFARLFNVLLDAPSIPIDWISAFNWNVDFGDWGVFDWLADAVEWVVNNFGATLSMVSYVSIGLVNLVVFVGYFVGALFF